MKGELKDYLFAVTEHSQELNKESHEGRIERLAILR